MNTATQTTTQPAQQSMSLAQLQQRPQGALVQAGLYDLQGFELMQRIARAYASSTIVPKEYQNNVPNCIIALNLSRRQQADELMVMQNLIIVHGRPTWSSQYLIATVNTCGRFSALRYEFFGEKGKDTWGCRAWAIEKATGERLVGSDITIQLAKDEGWYNRNGSKWKTMPQQMLTYRAGAWWTRAYAPELSMGLSTTEEIADIIDINEDGTYTVTTDQLRPAAPAMPADVVETVDQSTGEIGKAPTTLNTAADVIEAVLGADLLGDSKLDLYKKQLENTNDPEIAALVLDEARSTLTKAENKELLAVYDAKFPKQ